MAVLVENLTQPDIKLPGRLKTSEKQKIYDDSPHRASRKLEKETGHGINRCTARKILNDDLGVFPHKIQMKQHQSTSNKKDRVQFAT